MRPTFAHFAVALACCVPCACVGGGSSGGGGGAGAIAGPPATSGGAVGSACTTDGAIACNPGATAKVKCAAGAWADDGACGKNETCVETKSDSAVTATACTVPPTARTARAITCAKATACVPSISFYDCMNPPDKSALQAVLPALPGMDPLLLLGASLQDYESCVGAAKDCAAVGACFAGSGAKCSSNSDDGCTGSTARICKNGLTIAYDCAKVGWGCQKIKSGVVTAVMCGPAPGSCSKPNSLQCNGNVAQACLAVDGGNLLFSVDCGKLGATCDPASAPSTSVQVCRFAPPAACDAKTFAESCSGNLLKECHSGQTLAIDCKAAAGSVCDIRDNNGKPDAVCTVTPHCPASIAADCKNKGLQFCDGSLGVRSFDCALAGMKCGGGNSCVF